MCGFGRVLIVRCLFRTSRVSLYYSGLEAYTGMELMMHYELKIGNRFLLIKDDVADIRCICSAIRSFLLGHSMRSKSFKLKLAKILPFILQATGAV